MEIFQNNAMTSILGVFAGVLATVIVARYYFKRTIDKSKKQLTPYLDFFSEPLEGIDPKVREDLSIKYKNIEVENLIETQFLIANTGEKPIRDLIQPLSLKIPSTSTIVNAVVLHISPKGRVVSLDVDKDLNQVFLKFDLLNKDEFFVIKFLLNGTAKLEDFKFTITVDDLPPEIEIEHLPYGLVEDEDAEVSSEIEWSLLFFGLVIFVSGGLIAYFVKNAGIIMPENAELSLSYLSTIPLVWYAKWPTAIMGVIILVLGIIMMIASVSDARFFNKKKKLILPSEVMRSRYSFKSEPEETGILHNEVKDKS